MGRKFQIAVEQLRKQNYIPNLSPPPIPQMTVTSKLSKCSIPDDLELDNVYNPKYTVVQLISTQKHPRKHPRKQVPPRPPNSFFLFKNCYMLELRKLGYRYCMPDVCRQSKKIWSKIPPEVKERYDILAMQAQILHQEMYPEYKFSPKKRHDFKQQVFPSETTSIEGVDSSMLSTFTVTNFLGGTTVNIANQNYFESSQLLSSSHIPSTTLSSLSSTIPPSHELLSSQQPFIDYTTNNNNFLYLNNYFNNIVMQSAPIPSPEVNTIYPQILNQPEFISYEQNAFNQLC
jgi:hypothetical protein